MDLVKEKILELQEKRKNIELGGGLQKKIEQGKLGKLSARERLNLLLDESFYDELFQFAKHNGTTLGMQGKDAPCDGVVTVLGQINSKLVYVASQDFTVMGGSVGKMHAHKICEMMSMALKTGAPFILINDSGGARIQEAVDSLEGYGEIFYWHTLLSGVVPQISIIAGPCAGGAVYSPALTDFIIIVQGTGQMFIAGPQVVKAATGEIISAEDLGGAITQTEQSGNAHFIAKSDEDAICIVRNLMSYLPANNMDDPPFSGNGELSFTDDPGINTIVPDDPKESYDMLEILNRVFDSGSILQIYEHYAKNIITAFARINGRVIGAIANQPLEKFGALDIDASDKASRFIRFCNAFNIPLISFVDVPGFMPGVEQEFGGIIRHGAKMLFSYSAATVPKITIIVRKAYGGAYLAMCAKSLGADRVAAWPTAEIAVMGAEGAINVLFKNEIRNATDPILKRKEMVDSYKKEFSNPYLAAARGMVDSIIEPQATRRYLSIALEALKTKRDLRPSKKHGLIPL
ncbi:MAG TPA: carboxyl transferase domain-containing protein [Leptospiraceae bacterium]|nr:carboxyl transferase domain-containing protein [Leptospiraceae bacterium]HRG74226.1 carboxyl transferase domain-containing protein [Leptospiraceae bacterium]